MQLDKGDLQRIRDSLELMVVEDKIQFSPQGGEPYLELDAEIVMGAFEDLTRKMSDVLLSFDYFTKGEILLWEMFLAHVKTSRIPESSLPIVIEVKKKAKKR